MKIFAEAFVLEPENTTKVVEALIADGCSVVVRANGYDPSNPTIYLHIYAEREHGGYEDINEYFDELIGEIGGDVGECGEGHTDIDDQVAPPFKLQFAIDVVADDGIARRISCAEYTPERAFAMAIEAAGLLANTRARSKSNVLARRMLLLALGGDVGEGSGAELTELYEMAPAA